MIRIRRRVALVVKGAFAAAALTLVAAAATDFAAGRQASLIARDAARAEGTKVGRISFDPWRGEAHLSTIEWTDSNVRVSARRAMIPFRAAWSGVGAAWAQAADASVEGVRVVAGKSTLSIERMNLVGSSVSGTDLSNWFAQSQSQTLAEKLSSLSAATISIPEMTVETRVGDETSTIVYRDVVLTDVAGGKAKAARAAGASLTVAGSESGDARGAYGTMTAVNFDLALAARLLGSSQSAEETQLQPLYDSISVEGLHLQTPQLAFDAAAFAAGAVRARPSPEPPAATRPDEAGRIAALQWLDAIEADSVNLGDVKLDVKSENEGGRWSSPHVAIAGLAGRRVKSLAADAIRFETAHVQGSLDRLRATDLGLGQLFEGATAEALGPAKMRGGNVVLEGLAFDEKADADAPDARLGLRLERFELRSEEPASSDKGAIAFTFDHLVAPALRRSTPAFAELGYDRLDLSGRFAAGWAWTTNELEISEFFLKAPEVGALRLSARFDGLSPELGSEDPDAAARAARKLLVKKIELKFLNDGLVERLLEAQAKQEGSTVDVVRQADALKASLLLPVLMGNAPALRLVGSEIAKFIATPNSLDVVALSSHGIGLADLELIMTPAELLKKLEIAAYANR